MDQPDDRPTVTVPLDDKETVRGLASGLRMFGRYRLRRLLGRGGMGVVWQAWDEKLERDVALKFLPDAVRADPDAVRELKRETRRCLEMTHPNIVRVHDFVEDAVTSAIAMEFVDGRSLAAWKAARPDGCAGPAELAPLLRQLCAALDHAHGAAKMVHRDLKPANVLLTADGTAKITDFGIARSLSETRTRLTGQGGDSSGTLGYMSPQQLMGEKPAVTDDIYALGATLYELLTSKPPFFSGEAYGIMMQVREKTAPAMAARRTELEVAGAPIPREWEETVAACLAKNPAQRPQSAGEVARRLGLTAESANVAEGRAKPPAEPKAQPRLGETPRPPSKTSLYTGLAAALVILGVAGYFFWPKVGRVADVASGSVVPAAPPAGDAATSPRQGGANPPGEPSSAPSGTSILKTASPAPPPAEVGRVIPNAPPVPAALPREFTVTVDPADAGARLWLGPQSDVAVTNGQAVLKDLADGEHELIVQAAGYQPFTTRVTVKDGRGRAEAKLVAVKGAFTLKARAGTVVTAVDARGKETRVGSVPATGEFSSENLLTIGAYTLKLEHADCMPVSQPVELAIGRVLAVAPAQPGLPGELRVFSVPTGAEVRVNGQAAGPTPATIKNQPSEQALSIEVFSRGYRRVEQSVTLKPKEVRTLNVGTLAAEAGGLELRMTNGELRMEKVAVRIDGKAVEVGRGLRSAPDAAAKGLAALPFLLEGFEVGARTVEIAHPDYEPWKQTVTVRDQQNTAVAVTLKPKPARLALRVAGPRDVAFFVNGRQLGAEEFRNGEVTLPAQEELALEVRAQGYQSAARKLTLPANGADTWQATLEKLRGPEAGQPWTIPDLGLVMQPIAAGTFTMGDGSYAHRVTLTQSFWMGRTEVTQREWSAVIGSTPSGFKGDDRPVENVSWTDAMEFCRKLTERERSAGRLPDGYAYTLPTEAQWEYACRAGTTGDYAGDLDAMAWYGANSGNTTHPVGQKRANAWGFHDMHGNVWEWCADWFGNYPGGSVRDPTGPSSGSDRVFRSGGWGGAADLCRSAYRLGNEPGVCNGVLGFRVALAQSPSIAKQAENAETAPVGKVATASEKQPFPTLKGPWENTLGMKFVPVPGTNPLFCIWETRVQDFEAFVRATRYNADEGMFSLRSDDWKQRGDTWRSPGFAQGPTHPVCGVSWDDAQAFCTWLTEKERAAGRLGPTQKYRLPTDAEWSLAVGLDRESGSTPQEKDKKIKDVYPWGTEWPPPAGAGNYAGSEAKDENWPSNYPVIEGYRDRYPRTALAGSFAANRFGLYDLGGNVGEWCEDYHNGQSGSRVLRGGSFGESLPGNLLSSCRYDFGPDSRLVLVGFRCVVAVASSPKAAKNSDGDVGLTVPGGTKTALGPASGQPWTIPDLGLVMQPVAAGTFTMGSENGDSDEKPVTRVTISRLFWLGRTEVTQAQWQALMGSNPSNFKGDDRPVEQVSWTDAMEFCRKLTDRERAAGRLPEGYAYTLPTEAQWEYACRAGTTGDFAGNLDDMVWYGSNSGSTTHPVGQKQANAWGLYDMHGNVWEWCLDWFGNYPGGSVRDPTGRPSGSNRVGRGGSWFSDAGDCRSASRYIRGPSNPVNNLGFRVALGPSR